MNTSTPPVQATEVPHQLFNAAIQAGDAVRKLATASSQNLGADCFLHAKLTQALLADLDITTTLQVGFAAWRVGPGDGDVISHRFGPGNMVPIPGAAALPYHAWLETADGFIIDTTCYQLRSKAAELDAFDGQTTDVRWCPDLVVIHRTDTHRYATVRDQSVGMMFYLRVPELLARVDSGRALDAEELSLARFIMRNPDVQVQGVCSVLPANAIAASQRQAMAA